MGLFHLFTSKQITESEWGLYVKIYQESPHASFFELQIYVKDEMYLTNTLLTVPLLIPG